MRAPLLSRTLYFVPKVSRIVSQLAAKTHQIQSLGQLFNFLGGGGGGGGMPLEEHGLHATLCIFTITSLVGCN